MGSSDLPCTRIGCSATNAAPCAYVDRRGSACATAWCPDDQLLVAGQPYCPRHARVVRVLNADGPGSDPLPDVDNRAASLVDFIAEAVGPSMGLALHRAWPGDLTLDALPLAVQYAAPNRRRVWTRKWKLQSHTGTAVAATLAVAEDQDDILLVSVDSRPVADVVPPWIASRSTAADPAVRQAFYDSVVEKVRVAIERGYTQSLAVVLRADRP
jgi:hypothetical protein